MLKPHVARRPAGHPDRTARRGSRATIGCVCAVVVALLPSGAVMAAGQVEADLIVNVTHRARALHPGEIVVLNVRTSEAPAALAASAFGAEMRFFPAGPANVWSTLIGIDLDVDPGDHPVTVRVNAVDGSMTETVYTLAVEPKQFATRRLSVEPRYVDPPPAVVERIPARKGPFGRALSGLDRRALLARRVSATGAGSREQRVRAAAASSMANRAARTAAPTSEPGRARRSRRRTTAWWCSPPISTFPATS